MKTVASLATTSVRRSKSDHTSAFLAGTIGWTMDAFDFFLVVFCLTAIGREFHKPVLVIYPISAAGAGR